MMPVFSVCSNGCILCAPVSLKSIKCYHLLQLLTNTTGCCLSCNISSPSTRRIKADKGFTFSVYVLPFLWQLIDECTWTLINCFESFSSFFDYSAVLRLLTALPVLCGGIFSPQAILRILSRTKSATPSAIISAMR